MNITRYSLFLRDLLVEARIGIHEFERNAPQRLAVEIEVDIEPSRVPKCDDIADALDYDWIRDEVKRLVAGRHFDLQETLVMAIANKLAERPQIVRATVQTAKPDVYDDVAAVGCRVELRR